jgi:transposase InsO family protein
MSEKDERWALFWCGLLHPILFGEVPKQERNAFLRKLCETEVVYPDGTVRKPPLSTLKRKLKTYETEGFQGLFTKPRSDRDKPRAFLQQVIDKAIELKRQRPKRSAYIINKFLQVQFGVTIPTSTMYRYLKNAGATRRKLGVSQEPVRCRWSREHTHDLWVGDYEDGPPVIEGNDFAETHLCGFIDCYSRYFVSGKYYLKETFDTLIDSLLAGWDIHGASLQLYLDNAKVFVTDKLKSACYQLNIQILHRPVGDPSPGGLIERFFLTTQSQFESEVRAGDALTLCQLNRAFSAWLEVCYHQRVHSETKQTPEDRYHQGLIAIRKVDLASARPFFMDKFTRRVNGDFSDVQVNNLFFKVDPKLRGDQVDVWFDPYGDKSDVLIYSLKGHYLGKGTRHDRERSPQPPPKRSSNKPMDNFLDLILHQLDAKLLDEAKSIDFGKISTPKSLPFHDLAKSLAHLLGRQGGLTCFSLRELELIKKTHDQCPQINKALVKRAFEETHDPSLLTVLHTLKSLAKSQQQGGTSSPPKKEPS